MKKNNKIFLVFLFFNIFIQISHAKNVAVICGISDYWPPKKGTEELHIRNDSKGSAESAKKLYDTLLLDKENWHKKNIRLLRDTQVNRYNIQRAIHNVIGLYSLKEDDLFLFYFSGHISQNIEPPDGTEGHKKDDDDNLDEFLRLYDFAQTHHPKDEEYPNPSGGQNITVYKTKKIYNGMYLDDDIDRIIKPEILGTSKIIVIIDACHAQGMGENLKKNQSISNPPNLALDFLTDLKRKNSAYDISDGILIAACTEPQKIMTIRRVNMLAFTYLFCDSLIKHFKAEDPWYKKMDGYTSNSGFSGNSNGRLSAEEIFHFVDDEWNMYDKLTRTGKKNHRFHKIVGNIRRRYNQTLQIMDFDPYITETDLIIIK